MSVGGERRWLEPMEKQAENPCPSLPLIYLITYPWPQSWFPPRRWQEPRGPWTSSVMFLWRWCLGTQEANQPSGTVSVSAVPKNTT